MEENYATLNKYVHLTFSSSDVLNRIKKYYIIKKLREAAEDKKENVVCIIFFRKMKTES